MSKLLRILERENRNKSEENLTKVLFMEEEYVKGFIHKTMPNLNISRVDKVNNNYLESFYQLTKAEYESRYGGCKELILLHVTAQSNINSITCDNLDWRKVVQASFGWGTYFSDDAQLANQICSLKYGSKRAIVICKVLIGITAHGHSVMRVPPEGIDTCTAYNEKVFIKFSDNEFLPLFVAFYNYEYPPY